MKFKVGDVITDDPSGEDYRKYKIEDITLKGNYKLLSLNLGVTYFTPVEYVDSRFFLYNPKPFEGSVEFTIE